MYAFYAMLRTMKDNYENIVQRFNVFGGVGGFFGDFVSHTAQNTLGKMCSGETETETETGTTAANNCRKRTQRAGRPEIRDSPNIAIGFCSRSHSDSDSPSLALCRTSALSIALSLSQNIARVVRATSGSAHAQCSRCSCCSSCLHSWLSLSLSLSLELIVPWEFRTHSYFQLRSVYVFDGCLSQSRCSL